ncbi:FAD-dependent oxidoreductase [Amycolatopsis saalfeldensis]|uniref:Glycine/D-amino acid oxidase n=1 Tax=Amycolatopsis saalfeldensis TaxID=394193 RepID=A0A1H8Y4R8_9PSEU|nr:FAD-dependent oxidoreductase [Amycolatopsis saalfeldensis]SEP46538.1 Glycine/D-amino acid oxidase [Amycolatopsis saalfeldensis]
MTGRRTVDVAVVGTGVIGLAAAHALLARGLTVTVLAPRPSSAPGQASAAAGAMLSLFSEVDASQPEERVELEVSQRLRSFARYPAWLDGLAAASGEPLVPLVAGTWVVAADAERDDVAAIARAARSATHPAELHHGAGVDGLRPEATPGTALWLPTEPSLDITRLLGTLGAAVTRHRNAHWYDSPVGSVTPDRTAVRLQCADGTPVACGRVVLAAGAGIPALLGEQRRELGVPPVLAGRGVSMVLGTPLTVEHTVRTPNAAFTCGTHLVPRGDGTVYLGATNRLTLAPKLDGAATLDEIAVLIGDATRVIEHRLAGAELLDTQVGYRPYTLDHLPLVGPTADPRVLLATATYRCGVLLAPLLADLVADEITEPGSLACHPYRADRLMPAPPLSDLLTPATLRGLADHLAGPGARSGGAGQRQLATLLASTLPAVLATRDPIGAAAVRLFAQAPVVEVLPSLLALAERPEARPCPITPSIPPPRSSSPQPVSEATVPAT